MQKGRLFLLFCLFALASTSFAQLAYQDGDIVAFLPKTASIAILHSDNTWILTSPEEYSAYLASVPAGINITGGATATPLDDIPTSIQNWKLTTGADELSDVKWYLFTTNAIDGDYLSYNIPTFRVYFDEKKDTFVSIYWNDFINSSGDIPVTWRVDEGKAIRQEWPGSGGGKVTFVPQMHYDFAQSLIGKTKFVARVIHYDGTTTTATFDISGLSDFIAQIKPLLISSWPEFMK